MINTLPLNTNQNILLIIKPDISVPKGGLSYKKLINHLLVEKKPVVVDIIEGHHSTLNTYSRVQIRLTEKQKNHLAARIDYKTSVGVLVPTHGRFIIDPTTLPKDALHGTPGNGITEWQLCATLPLNTPAA